ncbi:hypothetical protein [Pontibacter beigongshangensis]|uniref:hypothetical protein n=1 Tax=Pontibacter beigongshangensis TaxID=2574733 RepID=UPI00164EE281|nr:hypothetical protein [Pontibacter beigongshangensis]
MKTGLRSLSCWKKQVAGASLPLGSSVPSGYSLKELTHNTLLCPFLERLDRKVRAASAHQRKIQEIEALFIRTSLAPEAFAAAAADACIVCCPIHLRILTALNPQPNKQPLPGNPAAPGLFE